MMSRIKISKKQREVLAALNGGMRLWHMHGINSYVGTNQISVSFPTLWKLKEAGLIEQSKEDHHSTDYVITELGKSLL